MEVKTRLMLCPDGGLELGVYRDVILPIQLATGMEVEVDEESDFFDVHVLVYFVKDNLLRADFNCSLCSAVRLYLARGWTPFDPDTFLNDEEVKELIGELKDRLAAENPSSISL